VYSTSTFPYICCASTPSLASSFKPSIGEHTLPEHRSFSDSHRILVRTTLIRSPLVLTSADLACQSHWSACIVTIAEQKHPLDTIRGPSNRHGTIPFVQRSHFRIGVGPTCSARLLVVFPTSALSTKTAPERSTHAAETISSVSCIVLTACRSVQ
jgi:hypothetical protein